MYATVIKKLNGKSMVVSCASDFMLAVIIDSKKSWLIRKSAVRVCIR